MSPTQRALMAVATLGMLGAAATNTGCASAPRSADRFPRLEARVFDGRTGRELTPDEVATRLLSARVVLVGEEHANPAYHAVQAEVAETLVAVAGDASTIALAVEWLPRSTRLTLEGWSGGGAPSDELRVATRWDELWGHDFAAYAPLLERMRAARVAILPINAEPGLARLVARGGVDGVPPERRAELPPLDSGTDAHRAWFTERMRDAGHGHAIEGPALERFYLAQLVWDETMAGNVRAAAADYTHVVVCAGVGHVERALGIPARLAPLATLVVLPITSREDIATHALDAPFPEREADLLWLTPRVAVPLAAGP